MKHLANKLFVLILVALHCGCAQPATTVVAPTGMYPGFIPLAVWRLQAFSDNLANPQFNVGCRMTDFDAHLVVADFLYDSRVLGPHVVFDWSGNINPIFSPWIQSRPQSADFAMAAVVFYYGDVGDGFDPNAINIYFTGDMQLAPYSPGSSVVAAATWDPLLANTSGVLPLIVFNDHAFDSPPGVGYDSSRGFNSIADVLPNNSCIHEACHYLGRFGNRCFGSVTAGYCFTGGEHVIDTSRWHVMRPLAPSPLSLPSLPYSNTPPSEKYEIDQRIFFSNWNNP